MKSLIREVMLPAAAAVGFLVAMAIPSAQAQEVAATPEPVAVLASATPASAVAADVAASSSIERTEATRRSPASREPQRCERVERIGKYSIRRCR